MWTPTHSVHGVVDVMNKFTQTAEVLWGKGMAWSFSMPKEWHLPGMASLSERAPQPLPGQVFIAFLGALYQGRSSFIMQRFALGDYLLQITKKRMLQMQGNDKSD